MQLYRQILRQAWQTVWRNKYLWFFGLFAVMTGGAIEFQLLNYFFYSKDNAWISGWYQLVQTGLFDNFFTSLANLFKNDPLGFFNLLLLYLILMILIMVIAWLAVVSQVALIDNTVKINQNNKKATLSEKQRNIKSGIVDGAKHFWPVFFLDLSSKIAVNILFVLVGLVVILNSSNSLINDLVFIVFFLLATFISIIIAFIVKYIIAYVIIEKQRIVPAIKLGWRLFWRNWLISFEMAFLIFAIFFVGSLGILLAIATISIPFYLLIAGSIALGYYWLSGLLFILGLAIVLVVVFLGGAILSAYQISSWTCLFIRLISGTAESKLIRLFVRS